MFILNGKPLALDRAFTAPDGTQYPANWLRLSTPAQRYYWGYDTDGNLIPKQLEDKVITPEEGESYTQTGLKTLHIQQTKETANSLLKPTDWYVIRQFERNIDVPVGIVSFRTSVISVSEERETLISSVSTVDELKGLYESSVTGIGTESVINPPAMPEWPVINN
jgi:hypothetical protein